MQCNCAEGLHFSAFHFFCECYIYMYMQVQLEETAQELGAKVVDSYSLKGIHVHVHTYVHIYQRVGRLSLCRDGANTPIVHVH